MSFHVGQKVVCIDAKNWRNPNENMPTPKEGGLYTVVRLGLFSDGEKGVDLFELGKCASDPYQPDWLIRRFRPVIERKIDISVFTEILNTAGARKQPANV